MPVPTWLSSGWNQTGAVIVDSDATRNVWTKDYAAGTVSLGGNGSADASMYTVIAKAGFSAGGPIGGGGGNAILAANNTVNYTPTSDYFGVDSFSYQVSDGTNTGTATVNISVLCSTCANQKTVTVSWNANPTTEQLTGYKLYWGSSAQTSNTLLKTISVVSAGFDPTAPSTDFNGWDDFKSQLGSTVCIKISAFNVVGESPTSNAICKIL